VDLLAWACYRYAVFAYDSTPLTELAEKSFWDFENFNDGKWMYAVVQKKEDLERWVKAELADPRSQERRRQWLANHST
jgi:hypothetical protein